MSFRPHRWFAASYDRCMRTGESRMVELRRAAAGQASGQVLEIGCGTGLNFDHYEWPNVEHLDATEPDPYMLQRARRRAGAMTEEQRSRVRLHEVRAEMLPFEDAAFDSAVATLVLCTVQEPEQAARELYRVLKPGGKFSFVEHIVGAGTLARVQRLVQPAWGWCAAGCHLNRDTEAILTAAGFEVEVQERFKIGPLLPAVRGIATRPL